MLSDIGHLRRLHCFNQKAIRSLPSWVPDLSLSTYIGVFPELDPRTPSTRVFNAQIEPCCFDDPSTRAVRYVLASVLKGIRFVGSSMVIKGTIVDRIHEVGSILQLERSAKPGTAEFTKVIEIWEACASRLGQS